MARPKRDFGISVVKGETIVDLTKEITIWCNVHHVEVSEFLAWMSIARANTSVMAKFKPNCIQITDTTARLIIRSEVSPKTAYAFAESFIEWYLTRIEDFIVNLKLMVRMEKSFKF